MQGVRSMADGTDKAIDRQSSKPLEEHERRQLRYLLERFWSRFHLNEALKKYATWITATLSTLFLITQLWPALAKIVTGGN